MNRKMLTTATFVLLLGGIYSCMKDIKPAPALTSDASINSTINNAKKERTVLYISSQGQTNTSTIYDLYAMNPDGSNMIRLTYSANVGRGAWSANGQHVGFSAGPANNRDIFVINANGSGLTNITNSAGYDEEWPEWSAKGNMLIFSSKWDFTTGTALNNFEIFTYNMDDNIFTRLTNRTQNDLWPTYSPDGSKIAFHSSVGTGNTDVFTMNADGSGVTQLPGTAVLDQMPTWSPDGSQIAFMSTRAGNPDVWIMNADGTGQVQLTTDAAVDARPSWSRQLNKIFFASTRTGFWNIYSMDPNGSNQMPVTSQSTYRNDYPYAR